MTRIKFTDEQRLELRGLKLAWHRQYEVCKAIEKAVMAITGETGEHGRPHASYFVSCADYSVDELENIFI